MKKFIILLLVLLSNFAHADMLVQNSMPAERMRSCIFAGNFRSETAINRNGGTVTGAPTFDASQGVTLDGTNDYLTYALTGREFYSDPISIVIEFTPDFNWNEDVTRVFIDIEDGAGGNRTLIKKEKATSAYVLDIRISEAVTISIPSDTYSPFWLQNQRNVLVISGTTGNTNAWLNGSQILTGNATAWTPHSDGIRLTLGASYVATALFLGTFHSFKVFHALLTAQEATDYSDNSTFTYMNSAIVFPMLIGNDTGTAITDASGTYSLDKHGAPVKLSHRGYSLDGANDYFTRVSDGTFDMDLAHNPTGDFSLRCAVLPKVLPAGGCIITKYNAIGDNRAWRLFSGVDQLSFTVSKIGTSSGTNLTSGHDLRANTIHFITASYHWITDGTSEMRIYIDDLAPSARDDAVGPPVSSNTNFIIGAYATGIDKWDGNIYDCEVIKGKALTQLQHLDYMQRMRTQLQQR